MGCTNFVQTFTTILISIIIFEGISCSIPYKIESLNTLHETNNAIWLILELYLGIDRLEVDGNICADGELAVHVSLNNAYLEDTRPKKVFIFYISSHIYLLVLFYITFFYLYYL